MTRTKTAFAIASIFTFTACAPPEATDETEEEVVKDDEINQSAATPNQSCAFDPGSGKQNLFGQRAFVTMSERDGIVTVRFEQFPSPAGAPGSGVKAAVAQSKDLTLHKTTLEKAKTVLRAEKKLWDQLFDGPNQTTFAAWEATAKCAQQPPQKPTASSPTCTYDPKSGTPNPLGMRSYFTLTRAESRVDATYEQFPSNLGASVPATISSKKTLSVFETTDIDAVRAKLLDPANGLAKAVLGEMAQVMTKIDETLKCE